MSELKIQVSYALASVKDTYLIILNEIQYKWSKCNIGD